MEYRVKYRDIPWYVAFAVLPAKILGTVFIKWPEWIAENWPHLLLVGGIITFVTALVYGLMFVTTGGDFDPLGILRGLK